MLDGRFGSNISVPTACFCSAISAISISLLIGRKQIIISIAFKLRDYFYNAYGSWTKLLRQESADYTFYKSFGVRKQA